MTRYRRRLLVIVALPVFAALVACRDSSGPDAVPKRSKPLVLVTSYPLEYFAREIAGDTADVQFPVPADADPAQWSPSSADIEAYQQADLVLMNGAGYEPWFDTVSIPASRTVNTSQSFENRYLQLQEAVVHKHGPEGEHAHEGLASHTWLDPQQARAQAQAVYDALTGVLPAGDHAELKQRWQGLDGQWQRVESELSKLAQEHPAHPLYASHPVYDYLARFCGWKLESMHWEPDETPDEAQWEKFAALHAAHGGRFMLWEAPPTEATRARLEEQFAVRSVVYYPCGNRPADGDLLTTMQANVTRLGEALR